MAALFYFGAPHSETLAGLGGPGRDERWERIDVHATALTGLLLILVIIGACRSRSPRARTAAYTQLRAITASPTSHAMASLRWRSSPPGRCGA